MLIRLLKIVLVIPLAFAQTFIQVPYLLIRYIITGKGICDSDPWVAKLFNK